MPPLQTLLGEGTWDGDIGLMLITMVEMLYNGDGGDVESVGKLWKVLERVGKCGKVLESGVLMIFMKPPVARTRLDGEARLELRWKDHQFDI